jgi:NCS1 family nucleobase:cation symporter-1
VGFTNLYYMCFLAGSLISGFVYAVLHIVFPAPSVQAFVESSSTPSELMARYQEKWDLQQGSIVIGEVGDKRDSLNIMDVY